MIDAVIVFSKGGLVLWSLELIPMSSDVVDTFIKSCLLEHRGAENKFQVGGYELRWISVNRLNAFIMVAFKGILEVRYVDAMLSSLKSKLISKVDPFNPNVPIDLSSDFTKILDKCDRVLGSSPVRAAPKIDSQLSQRSPSPPSKPSTIGSASGGKKGKSGREWGASSKVSAKIIQSLDYSKPSVEASATNASSDTADMYNQESYEDEEVYSSSSGSEDGSKAPATGLLGKLVGKLQNLTGNAELSSFSLEPVLASFKSDLMEKNVAEEVASKIVAQVGKSLEGTRTERFTTITASVREAILQSIEEILTPKKSVDVLKAALDAKEQGRVYSIAFIGVNGVGKSTSLAKVAYYLKNKGNLKVLIAACDTFRSGAVEQLRTHCRNLQVELFERGYGKDSADIAKQALSYAKANQFDVCLIDTAGRMQDNEPLMRAIGKLVSLNSPDLVLFVGEALVGHDSVDQLQKFNRALIDHANKPVDGIILTKYDTVDEKVGAALSMVFVTGQPIMFVGTGQKYPHLKKLQVKDVVKALVA